MSPQSTSIHRAQQRIQSASPPPPPPPLLGPPTLRVAATMVKIVEMHKLLGSGEELSAKPIDTSIYTVSASLRKLRGDWMLGQWIETYTAASLAFNLWRQRSLSQRTAGMIACKSASNRKHVTCVGSFSFKCMQFAFIIFFSFSGGANNSRAKRTPRHTVTFPFHSGCQHDQSRLSLPIVQGRIKK